MIVKSGCRDGAQEFQVLVWILGIPHLLDSQPVCGIIFIFFLEIQGSNELRCKILWTASDGRLRALQGDADLLHSTLL